MAEPRGPRGQQRGEPRAPMLQVDDLHVYYGHSHALQGVTLTLERGVLSVVGRNGMGKTTLCNTIMGLVAPARGSIHAAGQRIDGMEPNQIVAQGLAYVPQGRRVWASLSVDEHLRLSARMRGRAGGDEWDVDRIYDTFPRLKERRRNGGAQLSGGEQQMLAIGRALLSNPRILIMDEPTEGLAPVIVDQVAAMLHALANEGAISVLLVEQNLGVATDVSDRVAVMVNGRIARTMSAAELAADTELQQRLLGVASGGAEEADAGPDLPAGPQVLGSGTDEAEATVYTVRRSHAAPQDAAAAGMADRIDAPAGRTRWGTAAPAPAGPPAGHPRGGLDVARRPAPPPSEPDQGGVPSRAAAGDLPADERPRVRVPAAARSGHAAFIAGTFDTKGRELGFLRTCLDRQGLRTVTVDLSTSGRPSSAQVTPREVARHHPHGAEAVFTGDRGSAVAAMALAFERFVATRHDLGGLIAAGGSGATALATPAMRALPVGLPKVMVSTVASGDVGAYVGPSDICMMYSVTDVQGINRISERVLSNAAHALAGMIAWRREESLAAKPALGLTMFGLTTPCVQAVQHMLEADYDCLVFHATGTGGQSMEKLAESGLLAGVLDLTTTEVCDLLMGGVFAATEDRFGAIIRSGIPYLGSCGALDMVNFHARATVPERYRNRRLHVHNPQVTLMRTTAEENAAMGRWIAERLNRMEGPVRFLLPEGGLSGLDREGQPFWDPEADRALFAALREHVQATERRRLVSVPHHINDPAFAEAAVQQFREIMATDGDRNMTTGGSHGRLLARRAS